MLATLGIIGLFLLRVGIPLLLLVAVAILIDRWQERRSIEQQRMAAIPPVEFREVEARATEETDEVRKAA